MGAADAIAECKANNLLVSFFMSPWWPVVGSCICFLFFSFFCVCDSLGAGVVGFLISLLWGHLRSSLIVSSFSQAIAAATAAGRAGRGRGQRQPVRGRTDNALAGTASCCCEWWPIGWNTVGTTHNQCRGAFHTKNCHDFMKYSRQDDHHKTLLTIGDWTWFGDFVGEQRVCNIK